MTDLLSVRFSTWPVPEMELLRNGSWHIPAGQLFVMGADNRLRRMLAQRQNLTVRTTHMTLGEIYFGDRRDVSLVGHLTGPVSEYEWLTSDIALVYTLFLAPSDHLDTLFVLTSAFCVSTCLGVTAQDMCILDDVALRASEALRFSGLPGKREDQVRYLLHHHLPYHGR